MKHCVWKHYNQSASTHADSLLTDKAESIEQAVEVAFDYLIANDNKADEFGDDELREELRHNKSLNTDDYSVIILSAEDAGCPPGIDDNGEFELVSPTASDVSQRRIDFAIEF